MKRKLIEKSQESLIVCDNIPDCDFAIPYSKEEEYDTKKYINQPCPKCGENLLTEDDYLQHEKINRAVDFLNKWFSWITIFYSKKSWDKRNTISVHVHDGVKIKQVQDGKDQKEEK